jgi:hypothetical protein
MPSIHPTAAQQRRVGRVHDRIDVLDRDVSRRDLDLRHRAIVAAACRMSGCEADLEPVHAVPRVGGGRSSRMTAWRWHEHNHDSGGKCRACTLGRTLQHVGDIARGSSLPSSEVLRLVTPVCHGTQQFHRWTQKRDLKPRSTD